MKKAQVEVAREKGLVIKMKKGEILQLNNVLASLKIGQVSKEGAFALLETKLTLSPLVKSIEEAQASAANELKPEGLRVDGVKNAILEKEWNDKFIEFMNRYLDESISVQLSGLSREDLYELARDNNIELAKAELLNILVV